MSIDLSPQHAARCFTDFLFAGKAGCRCCTLVFAAAGLHLAWWRHVSRYGACLVAGRDNRGAAGAPRVEAMRGWLVAIAVFTALAVAAGVFYTWSLRRADPHHPCGPDWCVVGLPQGAAAQGQGEA